MTTADDTPVPYDDSEAESYAPGFIASCHLVGLRTAFADGTNPTIDAAVCHGADHPAEFDRLMSGFNRCVTAAATINARYDEDWNRAGGPLAVIAPKVRQTALQELGSVWESLCRTYISETIDRDRKAWDCPFCGKHNSPEGWSDPNPDADRCEHCYCILWMNRDETDWTLDWDETH